MAQFTIYKSSDTSAPVLTGATGTLVTVLDAVLVNGYGSKSAAGWTKAFSGTSKAAYRQASGSNQFYLRVQDDGPGAGTFKEARVRGYETMTDVDTGTFLFPTAAQAANGLFLRKSTTVDSTARSWIIYADDRTAYIFILTGDTANVYQCYMFGDIYSFIGSSDNYRTMIIASATENSGGVGNLIQLTSLNGTSLGHYMARGYLGAGTSLACGKCSNNSLNPSSVMGAASTSITPLSYPNPADGAFVVLPVFVHDSTTGGNQTIRGKLRGLYDSPHSASAMTDQDTFSGVGDLAGKTFVIVKTTGHTSSSTGYMVIETSNTLPTN